MTITRSKHGFRFFKVIVWDTKNPEYLERGRLIHIGFWLIDFNDCKN